MKKLIIILLLIGLVITVSSCKQVEEDISEFEDPLDGDLNSLEELEENLELEEPIEGSELELE